MGGPPPQGAVRPGARGLRELRAKSYVDSALKLPAMPGDGAPARDPTPAATRAATPSSVSSTAVAPLTSDPLKR